METILNILCAAGGQVSQPSLELLDGVRDLANRSGATAQTVVLGGDQALAQRCAAHTPGTVFFAAHPALATYQPELFVAAALTATERVAPDLVLFPAGTREMEISVRLAARLGSGVATDCVDVQPVATGFRMVRPVFGGKALAEVEVMGRPAIATLRAGALASEATAPESAAEVLPLALDFDASLGLSRSLGYVAEEGQGVRLEGAQVIVSGGRGIGGPEGFAMLEDLASALGGAVAASRMAVDMGWVPSTLQVGQTGKSVAPSLYLAVGISGASQHLAGVARAKHVVAINSDAEALIFDRAEVGVVADWREILPPLVEELRRRLQ